MKFYSPLSLMVNLVSAVGALHRHGLPATEPADGAEALGLVPGLVAGLVAGLGPRRPRHGGRAQPGRRRRGRAGGGPADRRGLQRELHIPDDPDRLRGDRAHVPRLPDGRLPHVLGRVPRRAGGQRAGALLRGGVPAHAHRHQLLAAQPCRGRHPHDTALRALLWRAHFPVAVLALRLRALPLGELLPGRVRAGVGVHAGGHLGGPLPGHHVAAAAAAVPPTVARRHGGRVAVRRAHGPAHPRGHAPLAARPVAPPLRQVGLPGGLVQRHGPPHLHADPDVRAVLRATGGVALHLHPHRRRHLGQAHARRGGEPARPEAGQGQAQDGGDDDHGGGGLHHLLAAVQHPGDRVDLPRLAGRRRLDAGRVLRLPLAGHEPLVPQPAHLLLDERALPAELQVGVAVRVALPAPPARRAAPRPPAPGHHVHLLPVAAQPQDDLPRGGAVTLGAGRAAPLRRPQRPGRPGRPRSAGHGLGLHRVAEAAARLPVAVLALTGRRRRPGRPRRPRRDVLPAAAEPAARPATAAARLRLPVAMLALTGRRRRPGRPRRPRRDVLPAAAEPAARPGRRRPADRLRRGRVLGGQGPRQALARPSPVADCRGPWSLPWRNCYGTPAETPGAHLAGWPAGRVRAVHLKSPASSFSRYFPRPGAAANATFRGALRGWLLWSCRGLFRCATGLSIPGHCYGAQNRGLRGFSDMN